MSCCHSACLSLFWLGFTNSLLAAPVAPPPLQPVGEELPLVRHVNPFVGVHGRGSTMPGTALPNGSIHPSPQTLNSPPSGYNSAEPITGFAQTHAQGTGGVTTFGNFLISPQVGALEIDEARHGSPRGTERVGAAEYSVELARYGVKVAVTPAHYSAIYRIEYPTTDEARLLIDLTRKIGGQLATGGSEVKIDPATGAITGRVLAKGHWVPTPFDVYFAAKISQAPTGFGIFKGDEIVADQSEARAGDGERLGAWLTIDTRAGEPVYLKIAVSFESAERAAHWLDQEIPAWDYEAVRAAATRAWDVALGAIVIEGASEAETSRFYSSLYHSMIQPRNRTGDRADWDAGEPYWDDHYTIWDTYRTVFPLLAVIRPSVVAGNIRSFVQAYEKLGSMETAFIAGKNYHVGQGGDEVDNVIADAFVKEIPGVDWERAYALMKFNAEHRRSPGYLANGFFAVGDRSPDTHGRARSGSSTIAFAFNDANVATVAAGLGHTADAEKYRARSANWRKVWDPAATSDGFIGFIRPLQRDGTFQDIDPKVGWDGNRYNNVGFYEGTSWIYSYSIFHDLDDLVEAMGGTDRFVERLEHALDNGLIDITNEPSFLTPWLFHHVGRPDLSSKWAREVLKKFPPLGYPGSEDSGAMGSFYVWNILGLFPVTGQPIYYVHGPRYPKTTIRMESGKIFVIDAPDASEANRYIQSATLNGEPLTRPWLTHRELTGGGTLALDMGPQPGKWLHFAPKP